MPGDRTRRPSQGRFRPEPVGWIWEQTYQASHDPRGCRESRRLSSSRLDALDDLKETVRTDALQEKKSQIHFGTSSPANG